MEGQTTTPITLYVWPGQWGLPSFDPTCLAAVLYLQLTLPGEFSISECSNPDVSPSGQLPFLIHDQLTINSFPSIVKYVAGLKKSSQYDLDAPLTPSERSQRSAWASHIESEFGNLVYYTYYCSPSNWEKVVHPALASIYGVPQRYYVPGRIRMAYNPRLKSAGLWSVPQYESVKPSFGKEKKEAEAKEETKGAFARAFEKEKIQGKAKEILGIYARLLEGKQFVYQGRPTTLDLILAAHTLLLISPPFPDTLIKELAIEWYDTIADHAKRIRNIAFESGKPTYSVRSSRGTFWDLLPSRHSAKVQTKGSKRAPEDVEYEKLTWGFIGLALGSVVAYLAIMGSPVQIIVRKAEEEEEEEEDDDDDDDELEEAEGGSILLGELADDE